MEKINKCYKVHLDFSVITDLDKTLNNIVKIGNVTIFQDDIVVWLNDDKDKAALTKCLKKSGIKEFYCELIEYENIGKDNNFNYLSSWFLSNYREYSLRKLEKEKQENLKEMYNNIQKATEALDRKIKNSKEEASNG